MPSLPVSEGIDEGVLFEVLKRWHRHHRIGEKRPKQLRYIVEVPYGTGEPRPDVPRSFVSRDRKFDIRHVTTKFHPITTLSSESPDDPQQIDSESA